MLGLLRPLGGDMRRAPDLHRRLGYVPQEPRFDPPLPFSVREFVEIGLDRTWRSRPAAAAVDDALLALDLAELARRPVRALSVGQRRRAMIARAMARRPVLLVLDEPTAHLDAHSAHRVVMDLDRLRREHDLCIVHVAHDLALAREYASHVALLHDRRVQTEPAAAIWADPTLQAVFAVGPA
jgi:ABC-type Mn2+/Zn2+ transport system ATPase subunit